MNILILFIVCDLIAFASLQIIFLQYHFYYKLLLKNILPLWPYTKFYSIIKSL